MRKKVFLICFIAAGFTGSSCQQKQAESGSRSQSLKVTLKTESNMSTSLIPNVSVQGEEVQYIDLKNNRYRIESTASTNMGLAQTKMSSVLFYDGNKLYVLNPLNPNEAIASQPNNHPVWSYSNADPNDLKGEEVVAGRPCKIYERDGARTWVWNNIILKQEIHARDNPQIKQVKEAVKIDEGFILDEALFKLPVGVQVRNKE